MKRFFKSPRTHLLLLAISLLIISGVMGLSAYITEKTTYHTTFRTATGEDLGFRITGNPFEDSLITPGNTVDISARAEVKGSLPMYVFAEMNIPQAFTTSALNSGWNLLPDSDNIYYYGTPDSLVAVGPGNPSVDIFKTITLDKDATGNQSYALNITGYAIQADNLGADASIVDIFKLAKGPEATTTTP